MNVPKAMEPWQIINSQSNGPYAVKTLLGWVVNGPLKSSSAMDKHKVSMTVNRISMDNLDRKSTRLNSSHSRASRMPSSA